VTVVIGVVTVAVVLVGVVTVTAVIGVLMVTVAGDVGVGSVGTETVGTWSVEGTSDAAASAVEEPDAGVASPLESCVAALILDPPAVLE
jgi:hypothetical protein